MSVKLFCNQCQKHIRDAEQRDFAKLTGEEICEDCAGRNKQAFKEIDKIQAEARAVINKLGDKYKVMLDETFRKVIKGP
jgi:excinuclease UvrABC ATPase subunit